MCPQFFLQSFLLFPKGGVSLVWPFTFYLGSDQHTVNPSKHHQKTLDPFKIKPRTFIFVVICIREQIFVLLSNGYTTHIPILITLYHQIT